MTARGLRFVPYDELGGTPNVVVDGAAAGATVLTLSHWPHTPVPDGLARDLSAEMAFGYLGRTDLHGRAVAVTNNHFDQDGLVSVFALVDPEPALERQALLVDVAAAGDFATYRRRDAARVSMAIASYADPVHSPLGAAPDDHAAWAARLYPELLGRLTELCDHPERARDLWAEEDAVLTASERLIASGRVVVEEVAHLDLAVFTVPVDAPDAGGHRFGTRRVAGLHPMAVHNATSRFAVLCVRGSRYEFTYRYESWVQYRTRRPRARVDLGPLAAALTAEETGGGEWVFEGVGELIPRLYRRGEAETSIPLQRFRAHLERHLAEAPPAWDPYRAAGP